MIAPLLAGLLAAAPGCTAGGEFRPELCPTGLPAVAALTVVEQGVAMWQDGDDPDCASFRPSEADLRRFFRRAGRADPRAVHYTLPESPCIATGTIAFADGSRGTWQVDRYALGWLDRPGHERVTLYCRACRRLPWRQ